MVTYHDLTSRLYGTGVIGHWLCDGVVTYVGPTDSDVSDCELMVGYHG